MSDDVGDKVAGDAEPTDSDESLIVRGVYDVVNKEEDV